MPVFKKDITIQGQPIWLGVSFGEVVGQQKWSETEVSGDAYSISSKTQENLEFWIKEPGGNESHIRLANTGVGVRPGQLVWMAWGGRSGEENGDYLLGGNLSDNTEIDFKGNKAGWGQWWLKLSASLRAESKRLFLMHYAAWFAGLYLANEAFLQPSGRNGVEIWGPVVLVAFAALAGAWISHAFHWQPVYFGKAAAAKENIQQIVKDMVAAEADAYQARQQKVG